jgi:hypothetical protein
MNPIGSVGRGACPVLENTTIIYMGPTALLCCTFLLYHPHCMAIEYIIISSSDKIRFLLVSPTSVWFGIILMKKYALAVATKSNLLAATTTTTTTRMDACPKKMNLAANSRKRRKSLPKKNGLRAFRITARCLSWIPDQVSLSTYRPAWMDGGVFLNLRLT